MSKEFFRNEQWVVTDEGIDTVDGKYFIEASRLKENDWLGHMAEKIWVKFDLFADAYRAALTAHHKHVVNLDELITEAKAWRAEADGIDAVFREMFPHHNGIFSAHDLLNGCYAQAEAEYYRRQQLK